VADTMDEGDPSGASAQPWKAGQGGSCWGPSSSEGPQKHDLTMFSKWIM
jgi:hypothetical protein